MARAWYKQESKNFVKELWCQFSCMEKTTVKGNSKHPVYDFLTDVNKNGVKSSKVTWNFQKYLIMRRVNWFDVISPSTQPDDPRIIKWVKS
ncbi:MAG: hypothetical protein CM15mP32_6560 [Flavobacteriaceae bacterium]|nr:MAG: hypothetical protein CM15mP32_6560 [Flavobacteriaceae bacterium]